MRSSKLAISMSVFLVVLLVSLGVTTAQARSGNVKWERIVGLTQPPSIVGGINSVGFPWTATRGQARVNLRTDQVMFDVNGLVLAGSPAEAVIGTRAPAITMVKGTLVCDPLGTSTGPSLFDTGSVPLSKQGNADFQGTVSLPNACINPAFLIRVATGFLTDRWIAHGAVRTP